MLSESIRNENERKTSSSQLNIQLLDSLSKFNREKITERAVHAHGAGGYAEFEVRLNRFLLLLVTVDYDTF